MTKPLTVWLTPPGPNPWKIITILHELGVPYEINAIKFDDVKKPPFIHVNPNGRVPAIVDPNTEITLWETGAIIQYLEEVYDTEKKLTNASLQDKHLVNQWLYYQTSGQGPYFGQCAWFNVLHHEKIPSAIERYQNEVRRILGVLEGALAGKDWLVGGKCTVADLAFVPWNSQLDKLLPQTGEHLLAPWPNVKAWHERMQARDSWARSMEIRERLMDDQGLGQYGMPKGINSFKEYEEHIAKEAEEK